MLKVGDVVRRKENYQNGPWGFGNKSVTITEVFHNLIRIKENSNHHGLWYVADYFDLIEKVNFYPCIKEIPPQEARKELIEGPLVKGIQIERINPLKDAVQLDFLEHSRIYDEKRLRETAAAFIAVADVLKENSRG